MASRSTDHSPASRPRYASASVGYAATEQVQFCCLDFGGGSPRRCCRAAARPVPCADAAIWINAPHHRPGHKGGPRARGRVLPGTGSSPCATTGPVAPKWLRTGRALPDEDLADGQARRRVPDPRRDPPPCRPDLESMETFASIVSELSYGVHVIITATRWAGSSPRSDLLGTHIELRLGDPIDSNCRW